MTARQVGFAVAGDLWRPVQAAGGLKTTGLLPGTATSGAVVSQAAAWRIMQAEQPGLHPPLVRLNPLCKFDRSPMIPT